MENKDLLKEHIDNITDEKPSEAVPSNGADHQDSETIKFRDDYKMNTFTYS